MQHSKKFMLTPGLVEEDFEIQSGEKRCPGTVNEWLSHFFSFGCTNNWSAPGQVVDQSSGKVRAGQ